MKERPLILKGWEVRAIRERRKTQKRFVMKPQPNRGSVLNRMQSGYSDGCIRAVFEQDDEPNAYGIKCPYGQPGDRLWVKEAHRLLNCECETCRNPGQVWYEADCSGYENAQFERLRPSIHMPRWASRITLEITGVRVQRLQDITPEDCIAEGITVPRCGCDVCSTQAVICTADASEYVMAYKSLWESINGPGSWDANDWVWVVEFMELDGTK